MPINHSTLVEVLEANRSGQRAICYLEGENSEREVAYGELYERAVGILHHLQKLGAGRADKLIIFLSNNEQFLDGYWAALTGGIIPVPLAVGISDEHRHKLLRVARKLGQPYLYTDRKNLERLGTFAASVGESATFEALRKRAFLVDQLDDISRAGKIARVAPDDVAFIQFSSGSTSEPKGIVLTHRNIIANARSASAAARFSDADASLSWMPLTHDMGLIGMHLFMFASGMRVHLMPTELFIRRPLLWMQFADRKRITVTSSPNFGFRHYLKVLGERTPDVRDLSCIRILFNGAEPISPALCDEFMSRMASTGLPRRAMYPVYGLAEATLAMSFPEIGSEYHATNFNRHQLGVGQRAEIVPADHPDGLALMAVGRPLPATEIRFVGEDRTALPDGTVGHLLIRGENVTRGYYEAPEINARTITADGWLDTGDLGLFLNGEVYITGRAKEIIFVNGQNYYPHDLENIALRAPDLELGKVVAAATRRGKAVEDELTIFVLHRGSMPEFLPLANEVSRLVNEHAGLEVAQVVPVKRIPKTTSGKIQRHLLEQSYVEGEFDAELAELAALRAQSHVGAAAGDGSQVERRIKAIVDAALPGKQVDVKDNLFEIGASSLTLIQIHEEIDREYPGLVDLTELFDFPTVAALAAHLDTKLAGG